MMRTRFFLGVVSAVAVAGMAVSGAQSKTAPAAAPAAPVIVLDTAKGIIEIETFPQDAPKSVAHILALVRRGFYRGLRFHWVQPNVIQVGDPVTRDMSKMSTWGTGGSGDRIGVAETSKHSFVRGAVGLFYRTGSDIESSDSQFFIMKGANPALDGKYIAIGRVTKGMDIADKIEMADQLKLVYVKGETPK